MSILNSTTSTDDVTNKIQIVRTINEDQKIQVARIFYRAFVKKFSTLWVFAKNEAQAIEVLRYSIHYENGLYALDSTTVLGFLGMEFDDRYFTDFNFKVFSKVFGPIGATWRLAGYKIYRFFHDLPKENEFHIDPLVVSRKARGKGIGTKLLSSAFEYAKSLNRQFVILEVVDTNPEAKKLYERVGFSVSHVDDTSIYTNISGFAKVIHMKKKLNYA